MRTLKFLGAAVLPLLLLAGCSGGGSSTPATVTDFCSQYADAVCAINCGPPMTTCVSYQESVCQTMANQAVVGGKRIFNSNNMGDCIGKIKAAYSSTNPITPSTQASIDLACNYVFQGKLMLLTSTDVCTTQFDCAGTTNGSIICDPLQHLCATQLPKSVSQQCSDVGSVCATNTYCATTGAVSVCTAAGTAGAASTCSATAPCDSNSRCASGICMPLVASHANCSVTSDCGSGGFCDPFSSPAVCDTGLTFATNSPSCLCVSAGTGCPAGIGTHWGIGIGTNPTTGQAGQNGQGGTGGAAISGAAGAAGSAGAAGAAGSGGASGAAGGAGAGGAA